MDSCRLTAQPRGCEYLRRPRLLTFRTSSHRSSILPCHRDFHACPFASVPRSVASNMPIAFEFSVGDFVSGISLVRNLIKALQESGGSSREYLELIAELRSLETAF